MNATSLRHILSFLLFLLLTGCGTLAERQVRQTLRCAEEVLAEHPDSALTLLTPLDTMSLMGEEQAWYAVLRTQADYKLNHPVTDSLPLLATAYYGTPRRPHYRAAMAWYSLGCVYTEHNDDPRAIDVYLKARDLFPDTLCRYYALTEQNLGRHYLNKWMFAEAKEVLTSCRAHLIELSDSTRVPFADFYLSYANLVLGDYEAAEKGYESVLHNKLSSQYCQTTSIFQLAKVSYAKADYVKALSFINQYLRIARPSAYGTAYSIKGDIFYNANQLDSAYYYYSQSSFLDGGVYMKADNCKKLLELSLLHQNDSLYTLFKQQQELQDSVYHIRETKEINDILESHAEEVHELKEREERTRLVILLSAAVLTLLLLFLFLYTRADRRRKQEQLRLVQQLRAKEVEIMELNALLPTDRSRLLALYRQEAAVCRSLALSQESVRRLSIGRNKAQSLSVQERDALLAAVRESYVTLFQKVHSDGSFMSEQDRDICALSHLQIPTHDIAEILVVAEETVRTHKHRMKQKLDSDLFQLFFEKV